MGFKRYEKYKDSGIEWIGKVPENWEIKFIKSVTDIFGRIGFRGYKAEDIIDDENGAISLSPSNILDNKICFNNSTYITWEKYYESPEIMIFNGDIIFCKTASVGKCAFVENIKHCATLNPQLIVFKKIRCSSKYFYYCLISDFIITQINLSVSGNVVPTLTQQQINNFRIQMPPIQEQDIIADFLDQKTSEIDNIIADKEKLIQLLHEKRQAIISEAVTKGLDKNVPLKDSGVEWIGEIPEHWEVRKLKYLAQIIVEKASIKDINRPYIGLENIETRIGKLRSTLSEEEQSIEGESLLFKPYDVLFGKLRPYLAKCIVSEFYGRCTSELLVLRCKKMLPQYLYYFILSDMFINIVNSSTYGAKMPRASWGFIGSLQIALPSLDEQEQIVCYLNDKTIEIETLSYDIQSQIDKLKEYRQSLISEAVTGKIDVRDFSPSTEEVNSLA
jgi:restriction endonuclease S subunit